MRSQTEKRASAISATLITVSAILIVLTELSEDGIVDNDKCHFGVLTRRCSICIKPLMPHSTPGRRTLELNKAQRI